MKKNNVFCFVLLFVLASIALPLVAQTNAYLVKTGKETGSFTGNFFIGWGAKLTYRGTPVVIDGADSTAVLQWANTTGVSLAGSTLTKTATNGWGNAGATSYNQLDSLENGWVSYKVTSTSNKVAFGLSEQASVGYLDSIDYGILVDAGQVYVYNHGAVIGSYGSVAINDSLRVERIGNVMLYTKNQVVFYNQQINPKQPLLADVALYTSGASMLIATTATNRSIYSHFRSKQNGNWNQLSTWESSADSIAWASAIIVPDYLSKSVVIVSGDTVTITGSVSIARTIVNGKLIYADYSGSTLTIAADTIAGLTINGSFDDIGPNSIVWQDTTASWAMGASGTMLRTRNTSSDGWRNHYKNGIATIPATANWILRKTGSENPLISTLDGTYYPNLTIENTSGSTWTTSGNSRFTGTGDYPRIKGTFDIGGTGTHAVVFVNNHTDTIPALVQGNLIVRTGSILQNNGKGFNLEGNLQIDGNYTGTKNLYFSGSNVQTIDDTLFSEVRVLHINKTGGRLELEIPVTVDSALNLTKGYITVADTNVLTIAENADVTRIKGYVVASDGGTIKSPVASTNPYLIPLGATTISDSADLFVLTLTPSISNAQEFTSRLSSSNTGFILSYDTLIYPGVTETVTLKVTTTNYTDVQLEIGIASNAHINTVEVLDQNTNTMLTLPPHFYTITDGTILKIAHLYKIALVYGYGIKTNDRNWVHEISYDADEVPVGEQRQYYDFIGRPTQLQTRNMATNNVLVSQTVYDNYGRAALQTLVAPTGTSIQYQSNFISDADGHEYSYTNFDLSTTLNSPDAVNSTIPGTLGAYYSDNGTENFVATTSYPYARTAFTADPSASAQSSAAAGDNFRMGSGHETRSYTMASGDELKYIYGSNTSYKDSVLTSNKLASNALTVSGGIQAIKSISIDADGKEVVSYSAGGQPIASCYSGIAGACSMTTVNNTMVYEGTRSVDIHLPATNKDDLLFPAPQYEFFGTQSLPLSAINYKITDLKTNTVLVSGTDYSIANNGSGIPAVTFAGSYATGSSMLRISFTYTALQEYTFTSLGITPPNATVRYALDYSRWSVNYYDLAGNLRKSVSAKGINCSSAGTITMATTYDYSSLGQLIASKSPDEGTKEMTYDDEGKVRFTRDSVQKAGKRFSYTNYDASARAVESGEYTTSDTGSTNVYFQNYYGTYSAPYSGNTASASIINNTGSTGMASGDCAEQNYMYYFPLDVAENIPSGYTYEGNYTARYLMGKLCKTKNQYAETWYGYNQAGQTMFTVQQLKDSDFILATSSLDERIKTVDYNYNTANGTLLSQTYQKYSGTNEELEHSFVYDAALRLTEARISIEGATEQTLAKYGYYQTGALKRKELGDYLQGIDYIYTVNGQLKSINHPSLDESKDPGQDGDTGSSFGKDVFGLTLDYHANDYVRTGSNIQSSAGSGSNLYNGLISAQRYNTRATTNISVYNGADKIDPATLNISLISGTTDEVMHRYSYDEEYRLSTSVFGVFNNNTVAFTPNSNNFYKEYGNSSSGGISYDANGNITSLKRNGFLSANQLMDSLIYSYTSNTNKLASIIDGVDDGVYGNDFNAATSKSFTTNAIGQMTYNEAEEVSSITYYPNGLVKYVGYLNDNSAHYFYDDRGKKLKTIFHNYTSDTYTYTWYVYDAAGNVLAMYESFKIPPSTSLTALNLTKQPLYGAGRIGVLDKTTDDVIDYEITDHLGNVRATIKAVTGGGIYQLTSRKDYYAFGGEMPGRTWFPDNYIYNYQGQENAAESKWQNFELRMHNSDLGRWMAPDPYGQFASPYVSMGNNPVSGVDPDGGYAYATWRSNGSSRWYGFKQTEYYYSSGKWFESNADARAYENSAAERYRAAYKALENQYGGIDGLYNDAGYSALFDLQAKFGMIKPAMQSAMHGDMGSFAHGGSIDALELTGQNTSLSYEGQESNKIQELASLGGYESNSGALFEMNGAGDLGIWYGDYLALGDGKGGIDKSTASLIGTHFVKVGGGTQSGLSSPRDFANELKYYYKHNSGTDYHLSQERFNDVYKQAQQNGAIQWKKASLEPNGTYKIPVNFYNTEYDFAFGRATMYFSYDQTNGFQPTGFYDYWDLDPKAWGTRSNTNEVITRFYNWQLDGGTPFKITYP